MASALEATRANKIRAALTMAGIVVGVGAVIFIVALGAGAKTLVSEQLVGLGTNLLVVVPGSTRVGGARGGVGSRPALTEGDAVAILDEVPGIAEGSPTLELRTQVVANNQDWNTTVRAVYPSYLTMNDWALASGRFFDDADEQAGAPVALLGQMVAESLFPGADPVAQPIRVRSVQFRVVGVLAYRGQLGFRSQDDIVMLPFKAANRRLFNATTVDTIVLRSATSDGVLGVQAAVTALLRQRHHLAPQDDDDFRVFNGNQLINTVDRVISILTFVLAGVAAIALFVAGIGIMNIMLVSVTERTREIGIRMAVGARRRDILVQFLLEAVLICAIGGVVGILLAVCAAMAISRLIDFEAVVSLTSVVGSLGFSTFVGVLFGLYPAFRASRLDPIEALRYE